MRGRPAVGRVQGPLYLLDQLGKDGGASTGPPQFHVKHDVFACYAHLAQSPSSRCYPFPVPFRLAFLRQILAMRIRRFTSFFSFLSAGLSARPSDSYFNSQYPLTRRQELDRSGAETSTGCGSPQRLTGSLPLFYDQRERGDCEGRLRFIFTISSFFVSRQSDAMPFRSGGLFPGRAW